MSILGAARIISGIHISNRNRFFALLETCLVPGLGDEIQAVYTILIQVSRSAAEGQSIHPAHRTFVSPSCKVPLENIRMLIELVYGFEVTMSEIEQAANPPSDMWELRWPSQSDFDFSAASAPGTRRIASDDFGSPRVSRVRARRHHLRVNAPVRPCELTRR